MVKHHDVIGRYVTIEVDDCEYKVFYLQNGKGIPLICQHTAGCHNHQWRGLLEDKEYVGPTVLLRGDNAGKHVEFSASVTLRYSDAPKNKTGIVLVHKNEDGREISIKPAEETSYIKLRI